MRQERHFTSATSRSLLSIIKRVQCLMPSAVKKNEVTSVPIFFLNVITIIKISNS